MNFKSHETATKLRGGYYTGQELASFLLKWVLQVSPKRILEPSCGDGAFFRALKELDWFGIEGITGFEIESREFTKSQNVLRQMSGVDVTLENRDFLSWALQRLDGPLKTGKRPTFDAVVGNPPFIRYQYLDKEIQTSSEQIFRQLGLRFTKHTNAWVPFVLAAVEFLRPGGRLAMVVPSEILHVLHAQSLRTFLTEECSRILVIDPEEIWFEGTLQGAVLLLAEKKVSPTVASQGVAITRTRSMAFLRTDVDIAFLTADYANGETVRGKWMPALLTHSERELLRRARFENQHVHLFGEVASVDVGIVTGANKFFLVSDAVVEEYDLHSWAHPMFGRSEHVPGVIYDAGVHQENRKAGLPTNFIWFRGSGEELTPRAQSYIKTGEIQELHTRYKCRTRSPWYAVPSVYSSSVGMLKRCHNFPRLVLNRVGAFTTDTAYRIKASTVEPSLLTGSFVNSLTAVSAELEGRHYGGGVLELVPSEIEKLLIAVPSERVVDLNALDVVVRKGVPALEVLAEQDKRVLKSIGFTEKENDLLREAWLRLKSRRQRQEVSSQENITEQNSLAL
ncbi:MAG: N-6 DNA methylase [Trueperaceae bacterium]